MTKALSLILGLLMLVQIIYPLGLPGLKRRTDAWKIAVLALALVFAIATLRPPADEVPQPVEAIDGANEHGRRKGIRPGPTTEIGKPESRTAMVKEVS